MAVLTAKAEEYGAFFERLERPTKWPGTKENPNHYAWTVGSISAGTGEFKIVLGLIHEQTNVPAALAALATFSLFQPRYLIFMGIAGSLDRNVCKGDVLVADYVRAYQYGSISETGSLQPRSQFQEPTDLVLRTNADAFNATNQWWLQVGEKPDGSGYPRLYFGGLASGDAVIENASTGYFAPILQHDRWLRAVEMEGTGLTLAVRHLRESGKVTGLMVVRGISDVPVGIGADDPQHSDANRDTRQEWTRYASKAAAVFLEQYVKYAFPYVPQTETLSQLDTEVFASYRSHFVRSDELSVIHGINDQTFDPSVLVPTSTLETWWRTNPLTIRLISTSSGKPVGYWHLLPLAPEAYQGLVEGRLAEREIRPSQILQYQELNVGSVYIYIGAVSASVKMQPASAAVILDLIAFLNVLDEKIGINGICAQSVSPDALPLMVKFQMSRMREEGGVSTWALSSREEIDRSLKKGRQELRRLKGLIPESSHQEKRTMMELLER
jgi:nucleoside phosphorylase